MPCAAESKAGGPKQNLQDADICDKNEMPSGPDM